MKLIIKNNSADAYSFADGAVDVAADTDVEVPLVDWEPLFDDIEFTRHVRNNNLILNDGIHDYTYPESEDFVRLLSSLTIVPVPAADDAAVGSIDQSNNVQTVLGANSGRKGFTMYNRSNSEVFIKFGTGATTTSFTLVIPGRGYYENSEKIIYRGLITAIWAVNGSGSLKFTELS